MKRILAALGIVFALFLVVAVLVARGCGWHVQTTVTVESIKGALLHAYISPENKLLLEATDRYMVFDLNKEFEKFKRMPFEKVYLEAPKWTNFTRGKPTPEILNGFVEIPFVKDSTYEIFWALHDGRSPLQKDHPSILLLYREFAEGRSWAHFHLFIRDHKFPSDPTVRKGPFDPEPRHEFFIEQPMQFSHKLEGPRFIDG